MHNALPSNSFRHVYPILLAGGTGTRLWPVSRQLYPKQLVKFIGDDSLIQNTIHRLQPMVHFENIRVVCGVDHYYEIDRHLKDIGLDAKGKILTEPCGRNTAPAVLMALFNVMQTNEDAVLCIFPADHVIKDVSGFQECVKAAVGLAEDGHIVTFGITPHYPETGYGYIEGGGSVNGGGFQVKRFVEKPDKKTAESYLEAGNFFWNSGMFTFKASVMLKEFQTYEPDLVRLMRDILSKAPVPEIADYRTLPDISIDYAIMERTKKAAVLPSDFGWSDIGSWKSLFDFMPKNEQENVIIGDVVAKDTCNSFIMGQDRLIATNLVKNLVIVDTPDSVFISDMENSRDVKSIVSLLKENNRKEFYKHLTVYHEWGKARILYQDVTCEVHLLTLFGEKTVDLSGSGTKADHFTVTAGEVMVSQAGIELSIRKGESISLSNGCGVIRNANHLPAQLVTVILKSE